MGKSTLKRKRNSNNFFSDARLSKSPKISKSESEDRLTREEIYETCLEKIEEGIGFVNPAGQLVFANQRFCNFMGLEYKDAIGTSFTDIIKASEIKSIKWSDLITQADTHVFTATREAKRGQKSCFEVSQIPVTRKKGDLRGICLVISDISISRQLQDSTTKSRTITLGGINKKLQKEIEARLREHEWLRSLWELTTLENITAEALAKDIIKKMVSMTGSEYGLLQLVDKTHGTVTNHVWSKEVETSSGITGFIKDFALDKVALWESAVKNKQPIIVNHYEVDRAVGKNVPRGHVDLKRFMVVPVVRNCEVVTVVGLANKSDSYHLNEVKEINLFVKSAQILLERKIAEEKTAEIDQYYRLLIDSVKDYAIFGLNLDGKITTWNAGAKRMTGYEAREVVGKDIALFFTDSDKAKGEPAKELKTALREGKFEGEALRVRKDGSRFYCSIYLTLLKDANGNPKGFTKLTRDISQEKKKEVQLRRAQKMEAIGSLSGGIAHDFNNILSAIIGYTELARLDLDANNNARKDMAEVLKASRRARELVKQILAFNREVKMEKRPVNIGHIVSEVLRLLRSSLPSTIEIRTDIGDNNVVVNADPTQMHQILMNLCTNASHAMEKNGGVLEVSVYKTGFDTKMAESHLGAKPGPYMKLTVSDTGEGIAPDVADKIFDPYFTTKEKGKGTGLGLAVVNGIVKEHDGVIEVYSELGVGTSFHVYLPTIDTSESEETLEAELPRGDESILLVDDEPKVGAVSKTLLEVLGYSVTTKTSSIEALELFEADPGCFDLVITDMTMPKMTGDMLAMELLKIRPDVPIILCTGFSPRITEEKAAKTGIRALLSKPILMKELAHTVRKVLD